MMGVMLSGQRRFLLRRPIRSWLMLPSLEDMGVWIRIRREDGMHHILLRWEYIVSVELREPGIGLLGLSGGKEVV